MYINHNFDSIILFNSFNIIASNAVIYNRQLQDLLSFSTNLASNILFTSKAPTLFGFSLRFMDILLYNNRKAVIISGLTHNGPPLNGATVFRPSSAEFKGRSAAANDTELFVSAL